MHLGWLRCARRVPEYFDDVQRAPEWVRALANRVLEPAMANPSRQIDPARADEMVVAHYRAEPTVQTHEDG